MIRSFRRKEHITWSKKVLYYLPGAGQIRERIIIQPATGIKMPELEIYDLSFRLGSFEEAGSDGGDIFQCFFQF